MENPRPQSKIFTATALDPRDDLEDRLEKAATNLATAIQGLSEKEVHDALSSSVARGPHFHEDVILGLLYNILTDPPSAPRYYRDLMLLSRDGLNLVVVRMNELLGKRFQRMLEPVRRQIVWLLKELMRNNVTGVDGPCSHVLRHIAGGDLSDRNVELANIVLDALIECRSWLEKSQLMVALVVYTYLRLMEDHIGPQFAQLRSKEGQFVASLLRERFPDCLMIGRDLVRLLHNACRVPELESFWKDLLHNPTSIHPGLPGVYFLLQQRTPRRFLASRLTQDLEEKLVFFSNSVKYGLHKRYEEWLRIKYLNTVESQSIIPDMIRFMVGVIHPTNEQLCSNLTPRWSILYWLMQQCSTHISKANARLALFYDWLFFQPKTDNIMNIEPAILLLANTVKSNLPFASSLLDFLCRIMQVYLPSMSEELATGIATSFRQILEKRVVPTLDVLFANPALDRNLRTVLMENFGEFFTIDDKTAVQTPLSPTVLQAVEPTIDVVNGAVTPLDFPDAIPSPTFSDEEEEPTPAAVAVEQPKEESPTKPEEKEKEKEKKKKKKKKEPKSAKEEPKPSTSAKALQEDLRRDEDEEGDPDTADFVIDVKKFKYKVVSEVQSTPPDINPHLALIDASLRDKVQNLRKAVESLKEEHPDDEVEELKEHAAELLGEIVSSLSDKWERGRQDMVEPLAACLCCVLNDQLEGKLLPTEPTEENLEASVSLPLFALFEVICDMGKEDHKRQPVLNLLAEMYTTRPAIGYRLLYYIKVKRQEDGDNSVWNVYKDLCKSLQGELAASLQRDIEFCEEEDRDLFVWLLPELFEAFPDQAHSNPDLFRRLVSSIDFVRMNDLVSSVMRGRVKILRGESLPRVVKASVEWGHWEQMCFWQLVIAHDFALDDLAKCLPLPPKDCSIATVFLAAILKEYEPTVDLMSRLLSSPCDEEFGKVNIDLVIGLFSYWSEGHYAKLAQYLSKLLNDQVHMSGTQSPSKRGKRGGNKPPGPSLGNMLVYCDALRVRVPHKPKVYPVTANEVVLQALRQIESLCTEEQKAKFSDLFEKVHAFTVKTSRSAAKGRGSTTRKAAASRAKKTKPKPVSDSDGSSEEEIVTSKTKRRRQISDSD